jgi:triosephosphate isomerase
MHKTCAEAVALIEEIAPLIRGREDVETVVCPPYTALFAAREAASKAQIGLGAQNVFWKAQGAYTGQISPSMLLDVGVKYVIIGHSESRGRFGVLEPDFDADILRYFGDTDCSVNRKLLSALDASLIPICCVGETIGERKAGQTDQVVMDQTKRALHRVTSNRATDVVFAYEPVWAIGTGEVCEPAEANRVCGVIRTTVAELLGQGAGDAVRIQYGGSVKPDNAADLLGRPHIDGALVGGASLKAADFAAIVRSAPA